MNIFVLDRNPVKSAQYHCNKHVVKMVLETAQILSTVIQKHWNIEPINKLYRPTHFNHPCALWARSPENFYWLCKLGLAIGREYTYRYGKTHKSVQIIKNAMEYIDPNVLESTHPSNFVMAMPDKYQSHNVVESYRSYYVGEKSEILEYKRRNKPKWINEKML